MLKKGRTPAEVQEILQDLPEDMDDIYNNILMSIPDSYVDQASRAFQWIAYSERQLSLEEVAEASILHDESSLDPNDRLPAPYDIVEICSGLVAVSTNAESGTWQNRMSFVHSSVKDFLISDAIKSSAAKKFAMTERDAQRLITKATLNYHLHLASAPSTRQASIPLLEYAEKYWYNHYMSTKKHAAIFNSMSSAVVELFDMRRNESMLKGIDLPISERPEEPESFHDDSLIFPPPLYYASILGMDDVVERLIARGDQVNKTGGFCGTALQAAAYGGHIDIITQLLSRGADVNAVSGHFGDALQAAACRGNTRCVKELLEWRATVGNACGYYGNALQAAASGEHMQEAQLLLEYGADLNGRGGVDDSALIAAALGGHHPVVTLLLENGADPDVSVAREIPTALYAAVACNHRGVVDMLLRFRADPNTKGGMYESALGAAAQQGHVEIVEQLVRKGADIFSDQNIGISALRFAVQCGHGEVVKLFLRRGRNLNLVTPGVSLLMEAVRHKQGSIVQVLLDEGANATTRDTHETTVLIEAAATGQETIVCMLLDDGVDPSKSDFSGQTALMKAVEIEHEGILSLLLQAGAEVGTTDWAGQSALDIARIKGNKDIVGFLEAQGTLMEGDLLAASSDRTFSKGREQSMRRAISGLDSQTLATLFQVLESQRQSIRLLVNEWNRMREERQAERSPRERLPFPVSLSDGPREHREPQSEPRGWQPFLTIDEQNNLERLWRLQYYYGNPRRNPYDSPDDERVGGQETKMDIVKQIVEIVVEERRASR